jgi:hypothetical protein
VNQLVGGSSIRRNNSPQRTDFPDVTNERTRIDIPDDWNLVPIQIQMRGFGGTPVRSDGREFANNQRLDVRPRRFLVVQIGANISDVRVGQTDNLPGVAGVGEDFLVTSEAGIENNFAAVARDRASRAAVKDAPVLQRENCGSL